MNTLPSALAGPIVAALNHLLEQEPWARKLLTPYAGRVIGFDAAAFAMALRIDAQGMVALAAADAPPPSVTIAVPLQQWPLVVADVAAGGQAAAMRHVRLEGDAELANTVSTLARSLRWDAAEDLARALRAVMGGTVGDSVAQRLVDGAQQAHAGALRVGRVLVENVTEYLLDEQPTLVRHAALDDFRADVAALRDDLARLEKRLERLERGAGAGPGAGPGAGAAPLPSAHR
ncbi:ubiquinone biosynthesis accessory factor UbiJ [Cupriavidus gilardii]|uniref:ubiquinone biosynthesis accessory factor UbiJ n=1 Tax=Cupriavidus gilardii TaxID=82541 RepID=UPI00157FC4CB|nr:SCP2 sterol-binding domain-containing protein [Cupriavidus gilardii]MCT9073855.1 SCP2 sterol-binding domain-containing protein [Cupriavidus gilardii]QKS62771.1 SCP2 sterol-binding domain-containing protein [Cupriavidus gilardii]UXC35550.1 SCP2 sterol-binding domain-containing protein [Cupriavidus gilardii]